MAIEIIISPRAEPDVDDAINYYDGKRKGVGEKFYSDLLTTLTQIQKYTSSFAIRYSGIRSAPLKKFHFPVHYIQIEKRVIVLAVLHTSMNPDKWPSV